MLSIFLNIITLYEHLFYIIRKCIDFALEDAFYMLYEAHITASFYARDIYLAMWIKFRLITHIYAIVFIILTEYTSFTMNGIVLTFTIINPVGVTPGITATRWRHSPSIQMFFR